MEKIYYTIPGTTDFTDTYLSVKSMTDAEDYTLGDDPKAQVGSTYYYVVDQEFTLSQGLTVVSGARVVLILMDGKKLTIEAEDGKAGINVTDTLTVDGEWNDSRSLTITSGNTSDNIGGTGSLHVTGGVGAAGIGGNLAEVGRNIEIDGGNVTAVGGIGAAGIGGGWDINGSDCSGGNIEIIGGTVSAMGGANYQYAGAGIGGGDRSNADNIKINGGEVTATGGTCGFDVGAAGIGGGGYGGSAEDIEIKGGTVKASSGGSGADAIGAGAGDGSKEGTSTDVNVDGSLTVKASSALTDKGELENPTEIAHDIESDLSTVDDFHQQYVTICGDTIIDAVVKVNGTYTFNGTQFRPTDVTVTLNGVTLIEGTDYTISSYGENKNAGEKAGSVTIKGKGAYSGQVSGTFEILQATVSVTGSAADDKTYDGTTAATVSGATLKGTIAKTDVSVVATGTFADKNAGAGKDVLVSYELTGDDAANYKLASSSETLTADISQKQLTVSGTAAVFDYSGYPSADVPAGTTADIVSGDDVEISATATSTSPADMEQKTFPGSHEMNVSYTLSGDDAGNYKVSDESMSGFIRIVVDTSNSLDAGTYGNAVAGYAGKTGAVGEVASSGTLNLKDGVTFSGSNANEKGALYNAGTANLKGTVTQNGANDGIYNEGTLNWDRTGTTKGKLVGYQYLTNAESGKLTITLNASDAAGTSYAIATGNFSDTTGKNTFWLTGVSGEDDVSITIGTETEYNDKTYRLYVDDQGTADLDDDELILKHITSDPVVTIDTEEKWFKSGDTITISGTAQSYSTGGLEKVTISGLGGEPVEATLEETIPGSKNYEWSYTYTGADTDGTELTVTATDKAGSETTPGTATYNLKVDTKAPTADLTTTEGYDEGGVTWYKQNTEATLSAKVTDATPGSGLDTVTLDGVDYESETAVTLDTSSERTAAVTKTLVATDVAGNETTKTFTYDVDGTGPEFTDSAITGGNVYKVSDNSYWVKQNETGVTATTNVSDAKSGVKEIKLDGTTYTLGTSVKINVNTSSEVALDAGSHTISAEDNVGNEASRTVKVGVDGTGPTISNPTVTSANKYKATDGTWVKQSDATTVKATITDVMSGVGGASFNGAIYDSGADAAIDTASESGLTDYTFTATDNVSNESTASVKIGVDGSGPEIADPTVTGGNAFKAEEGKFWVKQNGAATASATISDAKSGVDASSVKFDGADYTSGEGATLDTATESDLTEHIFAASDNVTNESSKTFFVGVDGTGPEFTEIEFASTHEYETKDGIWVKLGDTTTAKTEVTDAKSGVDALSVKFDGADYVSGEAAKIDTGAESVIRDYAFAASDNVKNENETKIAVGVDGTGPDYEIILQSVHKYATDATGLSFWVKQDDAARAKATVTDAKSGVDFATVTYEGSTYESGSFVLINTATESAGLEAYTFAASDNVTNASSKSLMVGVDGSGPDFSEITIESANKYVTTDGIWVKQGVAATAAATITDAKSGVDASSVKFDGAVYTSGEGATLDTAAESALTEHTFAASDNVTNESTKTIKVGVDGTGPEFSEIALEGAHQCKTTSGIWVKQGDYVTAKTTVTDAKSGVDASSVKFDGATYASGTAATINTTDESAIRDYTFSAEDNVTNANTASVKVGVDGTGPEFTAVELASEHKYDAGTGFWVKQGDYTTATTEISDAKSGVATAAFNGTSYVSGGAAWIDTTSETALDDYVFSATDNVANASATKITVGVDGTGPDFSEIEVTGAGKVTDEGIYVKRGATVTLKTNVSDALSGVNAASVTFDGKAYTSGSTVTINTDSESAFREYTFTAQDNVTNESATGVRICVDGTAADMTVRTAAIDYKVGAATVVMTASDAISGVSEYRINGGEWLTYEGPVEHWVDLRAGTATMTFEVKDAVGNEKSCVYTAGAEEEMYVNKKLSYYANEHVAYGFLKMMGSDAADTITFGANSQVQLTGGAVDLATGSNAIKVEKNADVDFICTSIDNVTTLNIAAGAAVSEKKIDESKKQPVNVTYQGVTYADFSSVAFSSDYNDTLSVGAYAAVSTGDLSANPKNTNKITVGKNASFSAGNVSDFYSINVTAGAKHTYDSYATDESTGERLFLKGVQGYTKFAAEEVKTTAKADALTFGNYTDIDLGSVQTGLGGDKLTLGTDSTLDAKSIDFGAGTDTLTIGAKSTATLGTVTDVEKLTVTAGKAATKTVAEARTTVTIDSLAGSSEVLANTFTFGNYTDVKIGSDVKLGSKGDTLSLGNYATSTIDGVLSFGDGNDTLKIGSDSTFAAKALDFGALDAAKSTDKLTVGARSVATIGTYEGDVDPTFVGGAISGVQSLTLSAGKAETKTAAEADTKLFAGDVTMLSAKADTVSIGNYAEVKLASLTTGTAADSVKIGSYDTVDLGDVFLWDGNDTLSIGSYSEVTAKSLDFGEGKSDKLSLGTGSTLTVEALEVDSIDTLSLSTTKGKESYLYLGTDSFAAAEKRAETDATWAKYLAAGQIAAIA